MELNNFKKAETYYKLIGAKQADRIKDYLHSKVELLTPLVQLKGREAVIQATCNYMKVIENLKIRAKFAAGDQVVVIYDVDILDIAKSFPAAALLTFSQGLIIKNELFFDASLFKEPKT